jgi:hypothetical protein
MVMYFCPYCGGETEHLNVSDAATSVHVTRRTIYNWLERALVHCVHRPSGRKFICVRSLIVSDGFGRRMPQEPVPTHELLVRRPGPATGRHP